MAKLVACLSVVRGDVRGVRQTSINQLLDIGGGYERTFEPLTRLILMLPLVMADWLMVRQEPRWQFAWPFFPALA